MARCELAPACVALQAIGKALRIEGERVGTVQGVELDRPPEGALAVAGHHPDYKVLPFP